VAEERAGIIAEVFSDLLLLGTYLKDSKDIGGPDHLRTRLHHLFHEADEQSRTSGVPSEAHAHARYAVTAYIDEMIINSRWAHREQWAARPLQYDFFGEFLAGEGFFKRLDTIRRSLPLNADLLEVYDLCLILGFEGQFRIHDQEGLRPLILDITRDVQAKRGDIPSLSPHGKRPDELMELVKRDLPVWVVLVSSAGIVFLLYLALSFLIGQDVTQVVDQLKRSLQESP
jgi:type VI secretion system protein ImpK